MVYKIPPGGGNPYPASGLLFALRILRNLISGVKTLQFCHNVRSVVISNNGFIPGQKNDKLLCIRFNGSISYKVLSILYFSAYFKALVSF